MIHKVLEQPVRRPPARAPMNARRSTGIPVWPHRLGGTGRDGQAARTYTNGARVWSTIYQPSQRELLTASVTLRPLDLRHVRHVHRSELRVKLAD
jgi:hypothetical protein